MQLEAVQKAEYILNRAIQDDFHFFVFLCSVAASQRM